MMQKSSKKPEEFLKKDDLHFLFGKVKELAKLNEHVLALLDAGIKDGCQVANTCRNQLIIITKNASIATTLRFNKSLLLTKFKKDPLLKRFTDIHFKVSLQDINSRKIIRKENRKMALLSPNTAEMLMDTAESIKDPRLKAVMAKIASHIEKR